MKALQKRAQAFPPSDTEASEIRRKSFCSATFGDFGEVRRSGCSRADDFETEVELLRRSDKFLAFLDQRLKSSKTTPIEQVEAELLKE